MSVCSLLDRRAGWEGWEAWWEGWKEGTYGKVVGGWLVLVGVWVRVVDGWVGVWCVWRVRRVWVQVVERWWCGDPVCHTDAMRAPQELPERAVAPSPKRKEAFGSPSANGSSAVAL